jgi:hypothetical protein
MSNQSAQPAPPAWENYILHSLRQIIKVRWQQLQKDIENHPRFEPFRAISRATGGNVSPVQATVGSVLVASILVRWTLRWTARILLELTTVVYPITRTLEVVEKYRTNSGNETSNDEQDGEAPVKEVSNEFLTYTSDRQ